MMFKRLLLLLLISLVIAGCAKDQIFQYDLVELEIRYPSDWEIIEYERVSEIAVEHEENLLSKGFGYIKLSLHFVFKDDDLIVENTWDPMAGILRAPRDDDFTEENALASMANRLMFLREEYGAENFIHEGEPETIATEYGFIAKSNYSIRSISLQEHSFRTPIPYPVRQSLEGEWQNVSHYILVSPAERRYSMATVYYGLDADTNSEADEIVLDISYSVE